MKKIPVIILAFFLCTQPVFALSTGNVGGRPATPAEAAQLKITSQNTDPNWFIYTLSPGSSTQDAIVVSNSGDKEETILVYPADYAKSSEGGFAVDQYVEPRDTVGKWIKLETEEIKLKPNESQLIPFTITIPNDPKLDVGEHAGAIMVQKKEPAPDPSVGGMILTTRAGTRVYITIPGDLVSKINIEDYYVSYVKEKRSYVASLTVKNEGNISQNVSLHVKVTNLTHPFLSKLFSKYFKGYPQEYSRDLQVSRDDSLTSHFELGKTPFGKLKVESWVTYANGSTTITAEPVYLTVPIDDEIILLMVLAATFIVLLIGFIVVRRVSKKKKRPLRKNHK